MTAADIPAARAAFDEAFSALSGSPRQPAGEPDEGRRRRIERRMAHFFATDPAGSWVAELDGAVVGVSQSTVRGTLWNLSLLGVAPARQRAGTGRRLLERAMAHGAGWAVGTIQSSRDPRAMALYARAGFDLHPALGVSATLRHPVKAPDGVRVGGPADLERAAAVDRAGRGASRTEDLAFLLGEPGNVLLVDGDRGYAVAMADRLVTLGALDGGSAVRLLRAALARADPGAAVEVGWVTAAQQWAIGELAACHLDLRFQGAVMVRGRAGPPVHHLPSGGYG